MKSPKWTVLIAAAAGLMVVLPFVVLEYSHTRGFAPFGFPIALFSFLWFLAVLLTILALSIDRAIRSGASSIHPVGILFRSLLVIGIAVIWIAIVNDQMPCFLGVPNCD